MYCKVYYKGQNNSLNDANSEEELSKPSHFIIINGREVKNFSVNYDDLKPEPVTTEFGKGTRLVIKYLAGGPEVVILPGFKKHLLIECFPVK